MNMKFHAWARGLLLSSFTLTAANGYAAVIGGIDFADNAFADRVLSTDFTGDFLGCGGNTASTMDQAVTGSNFNVWASYGDHEMFAGADGDYNSDAPPNQYIEVGFVDNAIVNEPGNDLVVFELGARNAFRVALDKFSIQNPYAPGAVSVVTFPVPSPEPITGYCTAPSLAYVDLSALGVQPDETVYRVFISSPLMENGDVVWNDRAYPAWGVPEFPAVAALNSVDKPNHAPEVELGNDVIVSRPNSLILNSDNIDVIDDSTPNDELTYAWTQTDGVVATISSTNTLATTITFPEPGNYIFRLTVTDDSAPSASAFDTLNVQVTAPDNTAPSIPANFAAEVLSNTGVSLTWVASTDNVAIKHYNIYRDDALLTTTTNLFFKDFRVEPSSTHSYFIRAVDPAGNLSVPTASESRTLSARLVARRTAAGADDAEEHEDGVVVINDGDLELVEDGVANGTQTVGVRFQNVTVPAGAIIVKAWLDFMADETSSDTTNLVIHGITEDNPVAFTATNGNISGRSTTTNSAQWSDVPGWSVVGDTYEAVDMADVVQELIDDSGWASGQAMAFVITGSGRRVAEPFEGGNTRGPRLFIEYQAPAPVNQPPVVSAGADHNIELPTNSVRLEGAVTDDNLTGVLTLTWSQQSGTGVVSFSDTDASVTDATFSLAGTYVLRLTATDGQYSPSDDVTVVVAPQPNRAPVVDVGVDRAVSQQNALALSPTVTDDGISGEALTYEWSAVSGPGTVTFTPDDAAVTSVTFSQAGSYVLSLVVDDGELSASDTLTVTVSVPDLVDPSQPLNLVADEVAIGTVELAWDAATDNVGVVTYRLYRDNVLLAQVAATEYADGGLTPDTEYDYEVSALDAAENESVRSDVATLTTVAVPDDVETLSIVLAQSDGAEQSQAGVMSIGTYPIDLVYSAAAGNQQVGLRFNNISVPSEALISRAYLRFCAYANDSATTLLNIAALDEADAEPFLADNNHLSGRATIGNVVWSNVPSWTTGTCYDSPDITLLAQQIVNNDDWRSGNSMGFKITGTGTRRAYRGNTANAPQLMLEFFDGNQAPVVNAGGTVSMRLPNALILNGSATDDGSDPLTYQWTSVTLPRGGVVTFADATAAATTASFNVTGSYTLRLTVSDGEMTGTADLVVDVQPANQAPAVTAGADLAVERPDVAVLAGTATDSDEGPDDLTYQWSRTSGPGDVTFTAANALSSNAEFSASGTYVLRLTVDDGADEVYDELTVVVTSRPNATPVIDAGENRRVSVENPLSLAATMEDDGINGTPSLTWAKGSGPGTVTFSDATTLNPTVTFSQSGNYVLSLTAVDGIFEVSDTLSVQVTEPDLEAPSQPTLQVEQVGLGMVGLSWTATDNVGITTYEIYRDGALLTQVTGSSHTDTGLSVGVEYDYQVLASDESGNESALSAQQSITLTGAPAEVESFDVVLLQNDGAEQAQNGTMTIGTYPIDLVNNTSAGNQQVGLLFRNIEVPSGAFISRAYLRFCAYANDSGTTSLNIAALDEADPADFVDTANHLTSRTTIGSVAWNNVPQWSAGTCYNSPDITLLAQLAVNKEEWRLGNDIGFKITGTGARRAYRGSHANAPQLVLEYFGGNEAPVVNAGSAASVRLPNALTLSGSATDGESTVVEYAWSRFSGPTNGTVTFASPGSASTAATFSLPGTYVLRLTADDGELTSHADVSITVLPANQAPVVSLGADRSVRLPSTLPLTVTVVDSFVPAEAGPTAELTMTEGPGTINGVRTGPNAWTVSFSTAGTYVLRVTVNDGELSGFDEVTVTVNAATGGGDGGSSEGTGSGGGGSFDLWSLFALLMAGGLRFGSVRAGRRRLSGGCSH